MEYDFLFVSNSYGEDRSAALIACELRKMLPNLKIIGASLLSKGEAYERVGLPVIKGTVPPSGGFLTSVSAVLKDLPYIFHPLAFFYKLQKIRAKTVVVVGDTPLSLLTYFAQRYKPLYILNQAKSYYQDHRSYGRIEKQILRRIAKVIFTHDAYTARVLRSEGLNALFVGNPMMDGLTPHFASPPFPRPYIALLPGSRDEAHYNLIKISRLFPYLNQKFINLKGLVPLSPTLNKDKLRDLFRKHGWTWQDVKSPIPYSLVSKHKSELRLLDDYFPDIIKYSELVVALAGTATEQAAGMGKPIVSFVGTGPQTTRGRLLKQERLLQGAMRVCEYPIGVLKEIEFLLTHPEERIARGQKGREVMGSPGGARNIARYLINSTMNKL